MSAAPPDARSRALSPDARSRALPLDARSRALPLDARSRALRFAGYAALFDRVDHGGDVIRRGAFARTLAAGPATVPLLWQHDPTRPIGRIETLAEDARGLRVIARLTPDARHAGEAATLLRDGAIGGLSFGYRVRARRDRPGGRVLTDLDLVEVSLVTLPMQPGARVHAIDEG